MKVYSPGDVADLLKIKPPTLRKYSIMLEERNYQFQRNSRKQRYYSDNDIITLRKLVTLKDNGMTLDEAVEGVMLWHRGNETESTDITPYQTETGNATQHDKGDIDELKELVNKQTEFIKELSNRLDQQQNYFDGRLKERDQALLHAIDERLEARKQIAAAEEKEEEKKGFFKKLFKRGDKKD